MNRFETVERLGVTTGAEADLSGVKFAARPGKSTERELLREAPGVVFAKKVVDFRETFVKRCEFGT
ncbi:MAG: hypothetical protein IKK39_14785 [Thermoguttaceae bacterium]|nr:hypothetical protein [Thermoguttaceae bacterium]